MQNHPYFNKKILCFLFLILCILLPINICDAQPHSASRDKDDVKYIYPLIKKCIGYIDENVGIEHLYSKAGNEKKFSKLVLEFANLCDEKKNTFYNYYSSDEISVREVTSLLKLVLESLSKGLMGDSPLERWDKLYYKMSQKFGKTKNHNSYLVYVKKFIGKIDENQQNMFKQLLAHLNRVSKSSASNNMNTARLVDIFVPLLLSEDDRDAYVKQGYEKNDLVKPINYLFKFMIKNHAAIFQEDDSINKKIDRKPINEDQIYAVIDKSQKKNRNLNTDAKPSAFYEDTEFQEVGFSRSPKGAVKKSTKQRKIQDAVEYTQPIFNTHPSNPRRFEREKVEYAQIRKPSISINRETNYDDEASTPPPRVLKYKKKVNSDRLN